MTLHSVGLTNVMHSLQVNKLEESLPQWGWFTMVDDDLQQRVVIPGDG